MVISKWELHNYNKIKKKCFVGTTGVLNRFKSTTDRESVNLYETVNTLYGIVKDLNLLYISLDIESLENLLELFPLYWF